MKILIVDDEANIRRVVREYAEFEGYETDEAGDGMEAVTKAKAADYDVIIMDIMMPKMNGIDALKEIRKKGRTVPVIMLTAKSEIDDKVMGLDAGANDYLTKPFSSRELLARLRALTRQPAVAADNTLRCGNLTLDRGSFELYTPSGKYRLAGKEFQMIELLMSNPGVLISTERFMDKIWGIDSEADISVVWTYLSYLRKKLTALDADVQIKATRNAGYSLEELKS